MRHARLVLLAASCAVVLLLAGGGVALRVGAADGAYGDVGLFTELLGLISDNYVDPVDSDELLAGAFEGMLANLDAHSAYLTREEVGEWKRRGPKTAADPGLSVVKLRGSFQVADVDPDSPAAEAGILAGDQIRRIGDRPVRDLSLDQFRRLLRDEPGTTLTLEILKPREGFDRETVELERVVRSRPAYELTVEQDTALLTVRDLARLAAGPLLDELEGVRSRGFDRVMLDLRNVTDGDPRDAVSLVELFTVGTLLRLKDRSGHLMERLESSRPDRAWQGAVAVLVNGNTAGGSEAVAKLLQSTGTARVYGETTFGLGSEPRLFELADGSGVLFSAGLWETAAGETWNEEGVEPDRTVRAGEPGSECDQLCRALEVFAEETVAEERKAA